MKISWLLRGRSWRTFHLHRCLDCGCRFTDDEPGSWADHRDDEFPELCSSSCQRRTRHRGSNHGGGCRSRGPFCPACAARVAAEQTELRRMYGD
jgi:hypothetical protein